LSGHLLLEHGSEGERNVQVTGTLEELVLELDPMETESMEEALEDIHHHEHGKSHSHEGEPEDESGDGKADGRRARGPGDSQELLQEHFSELGVSKGQGPETKVGSGVGNSSEDEFDGLNELMDEDLTNGVVIVAIAALVEDGFVGSDVSLSVSLGIAAATLSREELLSFTLDGLDFLELLSSFAVGVLGHSDSKDNRLAAEHEGNANESDDNESLGEALLTREEQDVFGFAIIHNILVSSGKEVVNHDSDDRRSHRDFPNHVRVFGVGVHVVSPLRENEVVHPSEETEQDDKAGDDFEDKRQPSAEVNTVHSLNDDTHAHVQHTNDDSELHLDVVGEGEELRGEVPGGVNTEDVGATVEKIFRSNAVRCLERVGRRISEIRTGGLVSDGQSVINVEAGTEPVVGDGEEFVVEETVVDSEETHHEEQVSELLDLLHGAVVELVVEQAHDHTDEEDQGSVTVITEHDSEQEGEGHNGEDGGVSFLVGGDTVGVGDLLEHPCHVVELEVGGGSDRVGLLGVGSPERELSRHKAHQGLLDERLLFDGSPQETNVGGLTSLHHVECSVDSLLLGNEPLVDLELTHGGLVSVLGANKVDGLEVLLELAGGGV